MIEIALLYCDEREVSADYRQALFRVARSMAVTGITPSTLQDSVFNRWLAGITLSQVTRSNYRRMGLTLWRHALDLKLTDYPIGKILRVKAPLRPPVAWSQKELRLLLDRCSKEAGVFSSGCPKNLFWKGWVLAGYETGIRMSDLHNLRVDQCRDGRLWVVQHKTGQPLGKVLSPDCTSVLRELAEKGDGRTIFRWALSRRWVFTKFRPLVQSAGLSGSTKWLRRSGATAVEMVCPGSASRFLGHLSPHLAQKHYLDPTLLAETTPVPPCLIQRS